MDVLWLRLWAEARSRDVLGEGLGHGYSCRNNTPTFSSSNRGKWDASKYWDIDLEEIH
ncbi:hypothetical protein BKA56DRAFT_580542 [Ilyonectria sp. MPI-CAGE-AT-0026]|nr:hypothetical protein BKA56DRAFT_580542 [Ilyonectria sp. MPI-CAGE-AT-0026]